MDPEVPSAFMSTDGLQNEEVLQKQPKVEKINRAVRCETCGLSLNSEQQAQQHYTGKSHYKKLKSLGLPIPPEANEKLARAAANKKSMEKSEVEKSPTGSSGTETKSPLTNHGNNTPTSNVGPSQGSQGGLLPTPSYRGSSQSSQNYTDYSTGNQSMYHTGNQGSNYGSTYGQTPGYGHQRNQYENCGPSGRPTRFSGVNKETGGMDPVSQAVYDNMMDKLPKKRKMTIPCSVCDTIFNSQSQADAHFAGSKHAKRLKMVEMSNTLTSGNGSTETSECSSKPSTPPVGPEAYFCHLCNVQVNSSLQYKAHLEEHRENKESPNNGTKHMNRAGKADPGMPMSSKGNLDEIPGRISGMFHCNVCNISVLTALRLQQHVSSSKHKEMQGKARNDSAADAGNV